MAKLEDGQLLYAVVVVDVDVDGCVDDEEGSVSVDNSSKLRLEMVLESKDEAEDTARHMYGPPRSVVAGLQAYVLPVMFCESYEKGGPDA